MNIYFSCIGGTGIGPLAEIAKDAGYNVAGSDQNESLMTKELQKKGIVISYNQDGIFLKEYHKKNKIDWLVYSSAIKNDHPELIMAKKLGIHTSKRDEFLPNFIRKKGLKLIAIAGTHGKTTTTSMFVYIMKKLGIAVSYSIGTTLSFGPSGKYDPNSEYFIYECDEYDRNFLNYKPYISLITSIDYDHPDTYPTKKDYFEAFQQFALNSENIIAWKDQQSEIYKDLQNVKLLNSDNINKSLKLPGEHNRRNASIIQASLKIIGILQKTDDILSSFPGSNRRFEKIDKNIYTDYGHHPTEIKATLQMAHEVSNHVILVYQPHQNIRQHQIFDQYTDQLFEFAEKIFWLPTYLTREDPNLITLTPEDLTKNILNKNKLIISNLDDKLWQDIQLEQAQDKLILCMGAGTIDNWIRNKLTENK